MTPNIPIPTDNIYKFYATFGFVLLVAALVSFVYVHNSTNQKLFELSTSINKFKSDGAITAFEKKQIEMQERLGEITAEDNTFFGVILVIVTLFGLMLSIYGFRMWHTVIQPRDDKIFELKIKQMEQNLVNSSKICFKRPL
jgi:hypothetical protein